MSGFCIDVYLNNTTPRTPPVQVVDLGASDGVDFFHGDLIRAAWVFPSGSRLWRVFRAPDWVLVIEGQPDRYPAEGESLNHWLAGRWGSFRGFEIRLGEGQKSGGTVSAFVDPLATRPMYYMAQGGRIVLSDKLATVAANFDGHVVPNWGAVLEAAAISTLYSTDTSIEGAVALRPGESVRISNGTVGTWAQHAMPLDPEIHPDEVRKNPAGTLSRALQKSVAETFVEKDSPLLLSGGLDSRYILALAGPSRKSMTIATQANAETEIAWQIAKACGAEFQIWPFPPEHYLTVIRDGFPLAGCMGDFRLAHHLGMGAAWRKSGVRGICHGFLFDTFLKGYFLTPHNEIAGKMHSLAEVLHHDSNSCRTWSGRRSPYAAEDVLSLLNAEGQDLLHSRFRQVAANLGHEERDGLDLTLERHVCGWVSKQCHYPQFLGWIEEVDVYSPVFHRALVSWHRLSRPAERYSGRAFIAALRALKHPVNSLADANTGAPIREAARDWRILARRIPGYHALRPAWRRLQELRKPEQAGRAVQAPQPTWPPVHPALRSSEGLAMLQKGISALPASGLFRQEALEQAIHRYRGGEDRWMEPLLACMAAGQWSRLLAEGSSGMSRGVRTISFEKSVSSQLAQASEPGGRGASIR